MDREKIKEVVLDIDEAIDTVSSIEKNINKNNYSLDNIKIKFKFLSEKVYELEKTLKNQGIIE